MKNKLLRNVLISVFLMVCILAGICLALGSYYRNVFEINTWVNNVYCTGKTPEEVNKELLLDAKAPFLRIVDKNGDQYDISPEVIGLTLDYSQELERIFKDQKSVAGGEWQVTPVIQYDAEKLKTAFYDLKPVKNELEAEKTLKIILTTDGYVLQDTLKNRLDIEAAYNALKASMDSLTMASFREEEEYFLLDLGEPGYCADLIPDEEQQKVLEQWQILKPYIDCGIVYDMGDQQISLAGRIASSFLAADEKGDVLFDSYGQPVLDTEAMGSFINSLADAYNTYKKELQFTSTAGESKTVPYVNYGTELDSKTELAYLKKAFSEKIREIHTPAYIHQGYVRGRDDIGDTYIEIDMGNQKLYAYLKGALLVETDIVTGNMKKKWSTPEGVVSIYNKQRNRTLRGKDYASFVKYWMPVKGGIGLHDASWRKKFGGEIYKTDGSHGCINIPKDVMPQIYDNFEIGTPVIMFY